MPLLDELREACAEVAGAARFVRIDQTGLETYAAALPLRDLHMQVDPASHFLVGDAEGRAAFFLTLDAINFGSGWWPTIRKRSGLSGYFTIATGLTERFARLGPWPAEDLAAIESSELADVLGQDPRHELVALYAGALRDLGRRVGRDFGGAFAGVVDAAAGSAERLVELLAGWDCFDDVSTCRGRRVPFFKRAQLAAADLALAGVAHFGDLDRLTLFADNVVPHVLHVDGVLRYEPGLAARIEAGALLEHGSREEVEIRACAVHAVELLASAGETSARELDYLLWHRGHDARYRTTPPHRSRCTAY